MSDPVRNIYKGRFVAKEKLVAAEARIAELEARLKAIYDAWNYEGDGPDPMYGVMNVAERKFWGGVDE